MSVFRRQEVRRPAVFWSFLVLGLLALVGVVIAAGQREWMNAAGQLVVALLCLSVPLRLRR